MQVKCCFLFLLGSLVALSWPQNHVKMQVFSSCKQKNTVKMQVKCIFWGPRAPKSSQLGLLRRGCEAPFKRLCKTRKHCKKPWFLVNFGPLGAWCAPPPPSKKKGLSNQVLFTPHITKLPATVTFLGSFFDKNIATYLVANQLRNKTEILWKNAQNRVNCEVKPNFGKKQLEPKSVPIAVSIGFSQSSHTLHALYQKSSSSVESKKTLQKCSQNPFFWSLKPFKKSPLKHIFLLQTTRKER